MRKNTSSVEKLELYSTYEIRGVNLDGLLNTLKKRGVTVYNARKSQDKKLTLTVNFHENRKFFAIIKELCYTDIRKIKDGGKAYPFLFIFRNMGLAVGAALFVALSLFSSDRIFAFSYSGSGKALEREIQNYLSENGVAKFTRFSDIDLSSLSDAILADNPRLSFVECQRSGNRLLIDSALHNSGEAALSGDGKELRADTEGTVASIKVYRGTALVNVGDKVSAGDLLVSGVVRVKEREVFVGVIASVTLKVNRSFVYVSDRDGDEDNAVIFAKEQAEEEGEATVYKRAEKGKYVYNVILECNRIIFVG